MAVVVGVKKLAVRSRGREGESAPRRSGLALAHPPVFSLAVCPSLPLRSWKISMTRTSALDLWMKRKTPLLPRNWVSVSGGDVSGGPVAPPRLLLTSPKVLHFFFPSLLKLLHFCVSKCSQFESSAFFKFYPQCFLIKSAENGTKSVFVPDAFLPSSG